MFVGCGSVGECYLLFLESIGVDLFFNFLGCVFYL